MINRLWVRFVRDPVIAWSSDPTLRWGTRKNRFRLAVCDFVFWFDGKGPIK